MSTLDDVKRQFQRVTAAVVKSTRDRLVEERDRLLQSPPAVPENTLATLAPPSCRCETCSGRFREETATRVTFAAWAARVKALEHQLFMLTWGDPESTDDETKGRDEPGLALAELCGELLRAIDTNRARPWERKSERDGLGRTLRTWETGPVLGEITTELVGLYRRAQNEMVYFSTAELTDATTQTRAAKDAALNRPLERPLDRAVAEHAGLEPAPKQSEADRHGLRPGASPDVTSGTIRFARRA